MDRRRALKVLGTGATGSLMLATPLRALAESPVAEVDACLVIEEETPGHTLAPTPTGPMCWRSPSWYVETSPAASNRPRVSPRASP
jgi:hypothetical protein